MARDRKREGGGWCQLKSTHFGSFLGLWWRRGCWTEHRLTALGSLLHLSCWLVRGTVFLVSAAVVSSGVPRRPGTAGMRGLKGCYGDEICKEDMHTQERRAARFSDLRNLNSITTNSLTIEHTLTDTTSIPRLSTYFELWTEIFCICRSPLQLILSYLLLLVSDLFELHAQQHNYYCIEENMRTCSSISSSAQHAAASHGHDRSFADS